MTPTTISQQLSNEIAIINAMHSVIGIAKTLMNEAASRTAFTDEYLQFQFGLIIRNVKDVADEIGVTIQGTK